MWNKLARSLMAVAVLSATYGVVVVLEPPPAEAASAEWYDTLVEGCDGAMNIPSSLLGTASGTLAALTAVPLSGGAPTGTVALTGVAGASTAAGTGTAVGGAATATAGAGAAVTGGGAALGGAAALAAAATFAGTFCGTTLGLNWLFGESQYEVNPIPPGLSATAGDIRPCADFGITSVLTNGKCAAQGWTTALQTTPTGAFQFTPGDRVCVAGYTSLDGSNTAGGETIPPSGFPVPGEGYSQSFWEAGYSGPATTRLRPYDFTAPSCFGNVVDVGAGVGQVNPTGWVQELRCNGPTCGVGPGARLLVGTVNPATNTFRRLVAVLPLNRDNDLRGWRRVLTSTAKCWPNEFGGTLITRTSQSEPFYDREGDPGDFAPAKCQSGEVPNSLVVERRLINDQGTVGPAGTNILTWNAPAGLMNENLDYRRCWVVGAPSCEVVPLPDGSQKIGGTNGKTVPPNVATQPKTGDALKVILAPLPVQIIDPSPTTTTTVAPTTTAVTTTTTPTTTTTVPATTTTTVPPPPPCQGDNDVDCLPPPGDAADGCWPSGWGWFNPLEWVFRPVTCAFRWLFVPPEPEFSQALDRLKNNTDRPPMQWASGLVDMVSTSSLTWVRMRDMSGLPCVPGFAGSSGWCVNQLDTADIPDWLKVVVIAGMWMLLAYSVVRFL